MTTDPRWDDETEDWPKRSWDFWNDDGTPVNTLSDLEQVTGRSADDWAHDLIHLPVGKGAPRELVQEAISRGTE